MAAAVQPTPCLLLFCTASLLPLLLIAAMCCCMLFAAKHCVACGRLWAAICLSGKVKLAPPQSPICRCCSTCVVLRPQLHRKDVRQPVQCQIEDEVQLQFAEQPGMCLSATWWTATISPW